MTNTNGRIPQILGAVLLLTGFVVTPVGCFVESRAPYAIGLPMVVPGGLLYIVGKLQSA